MNTEENIDIVSNNIENAYGLIKQLKNEINKSYEDTTSKDKVKCILNEVSEIMENIANTDVQEILEQNEDNEKRILIISEKQENVILPYSEKAIEQQIQDGIYTTKEEAIQKEYTIPLSKYKNEALSRVTEGYKLARKKSGKTVNESIKYSLNLLFERRLHPAIITACRNIDELDIYLACLEENVIKLFDFFEVVFEYAPTKVKNDFKDNLFIEEENDNIQEQ